MIANDLRKACRAYVALAPIEPRPRFAAQKLVLGAGAILADVSKGEGPGGGDEGRLEALRATAYGAAASATALAHTRRAIPARGSAGSRRIQWYFADSEAADHVRRQFQAFVGMSERIEIYVLPYEDPHR